MEEEIWKSLEFLGYPDYEVSNMGQVKSLERVIIRKNGRKQTFSERIMKPSKNRFGYLFVNLSKNSVTKNCKVHKIVALTFIPNDNPTEKTQVNHLDENKENNHVSNLKWVTPKENSNHATRNERISETKRIPIQQYTKDMTFIKEWDSATQASEELNICQSNITKVCKGKYKHCGGFIWCYKE